MQPRSKAFVIAASAAVLGLVAWFFAMGSVSGFEALRQAGVLGIAGIFISLSAIVMSRRWPDLSALSLLPWTVLASWQAFLWVAIDLGLMHGRLYIGLGLGQLIAMIFAALIGLCVGWKEHGWCSTILGLASLICSFLTWYVLFLAVVASV